MSKKAGSLPFPTISLLLSKAAHLQCPLHQKALHDQLHARDHLMLSNPTALSQGHCGLLESLPESASLVVVNWRSGGQRQARRPKWLPLCALDMLMEWPRVDGHTGLQHCSEQSLPRQPLGTLDFLYVSCLRTGCRPGDGLLQHHPGQQLRVMA